MRDQYGGPTQGGLIDTLQRGAGTMISALGSGLSDIPIEAVSEFGKRAEKYGEELVAENPSEVPTVQDITGLGSALTYGGERLGELIPQVAAPLVAGGTAALLGASAPIVAGAGLLTGALGSFGQEYGDIRQQQREQGIDEKGRAALFGAGAAALDLAGVGRIVPGASRILGDVVETGLRGAVKTGARVGGEEAVTEAAQTALERAGARKDLTSPEAINEYINAAAAGAIGGGAIGSGQSAVRTFSPTQETPPDVTPPPPNEGEPDTVGSPPPAGPVSPPVLDTGSTPAPAGPTLEIDGQRYTPTVTIDNDRAIIDWNDGREIQDVPVTEWQQTVDTYSVPPVIETPVATPPVVETPLPPRADVTSAPPISAPPVDVVPAPPVSEPPSVETTPVSPVSAPIDVQPVTAEQFKAAETATPELQARIAGKTMTQVARDLSQNAELPTLRPIMGRVANVLDAFEKSGIKLNIGIQDTRNKAAVPGTTPLKGNEGGKMTPRRFDPSINVTLKGANLPNAGTSEAVVAHELIHAVTFAAIHHQDQLPANSRAFTATSELKTLSRQVRRQMTKDGMFNTNKYREYRGNPNEIIAWALTDSKFQEWLKTIPTKTGNAFTDFVRHIGKLLGIAPKDQNALAKLIEITDVLIPGEQQNFNDIVEGARGWAGMGGIGDVPRSQAQDGGPTSSLDIPAETRGEWWKRSLVDRLGRLKKVESLGELESQDRSAYEAARKMDSKAASRIESFQRKYFNPIYKAMRAAKISLNDVDWFLYARAAEARNVRLEQGQTRDVIRQVEADTGLTYDPSSPQPEFVNAIQKAYADGKITSSGSGITTADAQATLLDYQQRPEYAVYQRIGDLFDAMHRERMELAVKNGLVSRESADYLLRAEPNYAPMKGRAEGGQNQDLTLAEEDLDPLMGYGGSGVSVSRAEWLKAGGRSSLPFSPLSYAISDAQTSIVRGERNAVGQLLMGFLAKNKSPLWKIYSEDNPPRDNRGRVVSISASNPDYITVKRNGKAFFIRISDPLLMRAVKAMDVEQMRPFMNLAIVQIPAKYTRMLARSFTSWNPEFFMVNYVRDIQAAMLNIASDANGKEVAKKFAKYATDRKGMKAIAAFEFDTQRINADPQVKALYEQFKLDGGSVGWVSRENPKEIAEKTKQEFQDLLDAEAQFVPPKNAADFKKLADRYFRSTGRVGRAIIGNLEAANTVFENGIRFAAYRAGLDSGMTRDQAAMLAREATVDFNKRGEAGQFLNAFYAFFNAGVQGAERTLRALSNNPMKTGKLSATQAAVIGIMGTAATLALYNAGISDEDDDGKLFYDKIPEYEKERNLIIMNPSDGKTYAKIPIPYGFGFFPSMVTKIMDAERNGEEPGKVGLSLANSMLQNFSPIQFQGSTLWTSSAKAVTPTAFKPLVDIMLNENFMGRPIYNEPFDKTQSAASAARFGTPEFFKEVAQFMNDVTGGEGKIKGYADVSPESLEYLFEFGFGGATNIAKSATTAFSDEEAIKSPVVRRFVGAPQKTRAIGDYYEKANEAHAASMEFRNKETPEEKMEFRQSHRVDLDPSVQAALSRSRTEIKALNKQRKAITDSDNLDDETKRERLDAIKERVNQVYVRFNTVHNRVEKREG